MIQTTRWTPDTCINNGCVIEYQWDDSLSQEQRVHTVSKVLSKCISHSSTVSDSMHYSKVLDENQRRNQIFAEIANNFPELLLTDSQGNSALNPDEVNWSFDVNRVLQITLPSLALAKKNILQTIANGKFGAGKIIIL